MPREPGYHSSLIDGFTPAIIRWGGRRWRCNMGSTWTRNLDHCLRVSRNKLRFELRESPDNRSSNDPVGKLRSEISGSLPGEQRRLPNGQPLWGAVSFIHHRWLDPIGMRNLRGGVHGQVHIGRGFGGSPALAFRRTGEGAFTITTRGENDARNTVRHRSGLSFGEVHDLVYRLVLHETSGSVLVWLDGVRILAVDHVSIGSSHADSYWNIGCYYAGGASCPVAAEYANHVYPATLALDQRIARPPVWPDA